MINKKGKIEGSRDSKANGVEKGKERERDTLALPCSRINKASHGKLSEAGYERGGGGRGAIKSSLEGWTAPNITKASSLSHRSKGSLTGKKARRVL